LWKNVIAEGRRKKEEGRRKREEGRKKETGRLGDGNSQLTVNC
jgi:hypothetical protein